jgi:DNA-binding NtrC family response regulator
MMVVQKDPVGRPGEGAETILLVDDEDAVRKPAAGVLKKYGYCVLQAATAEEALDVWKAHSAPISVLVTDMVMTGDLSGWELAQQLLDVQPTLKVIYTSGYSAKMAAEVFHITSQIIFLQKPYLGQRLAEAVRTALDSPAATNNTEEK